jgi:subtilisin family serine protease
MSLPPLRTAVLFALLALSAPQAWSAPPKLDARARSALARLRAGGQSLETMRASGAAIDRDGALDVFIGGSVTRGQLEAAGVRVRTELPGLFTASIPASAVERVEALDGVVGIRGGAPCEPELDVSVPTTGAQALRGAGPAFAGVNGQGVVIGIVDSGVDYGHGDFQDPSGATRILNIWDQVASGSGSPGYPYGKECTSAQIDAGTCAERDSVEHGTHAAGIAAGDGSQTAGALPAYTFAGMAPRADLVVVRTDFQTPEVIDAISYVFDKAAARGENAVVNLSLGSQYGSHDGASDFEQAVTALSGPGRIVVKSAGNDRGKAVHAQVFATAGGASATVSVAASATGRYFYIDGYYNATERLRVRMTTPNGTIIGPLVVKTENAPWPGATTGNGLVYVAHDSLSGGRKNIYIEVYSDQATHSMNGTWTITLFADQLGPANGEVDLWRYLAASGLTANFVAGNLSTQELITEPGNASQVVTVGAWVTRTSWTACNGVVSSYPGMPSAGNLAPFSSPGPTRDGRQKPDLVAPGTAIGSTTSFDIPHACPGAPTASELLNDGLNHRMLQGTSLSAPHVTGAVALLLQVRGALTPQEVTTYLRTHARADGFTGIVPSKDWGYGKLDLGDLIVPVVAVVSPNGGEQVLPGETMTLAWTATDSPGSVTGVDLQLSRTGPGGPFENIALGIANSGTYGWTVTEPTTNGSAAFLRVLAHDANANVGLDLSDAAFTIAGPVTVERGETVAFALARVSPNPTSRGVSIEFSLARESRVRLCVLDVQGRAVAVLADGVFHARCHQVKWDGTRGGSPAPAGLYFVCYDTPEGRFVRRVAVAH